MEVFYTSPWIPAEWIKAHGLEPRGVWHDLSPGGSTLTAGVCAFAEAVVQLAQTSADSAVVFATHCDQMRRAFDSVVASGRSRTFLFNLPATWLSPVAHRIFRAELDRLGHFLEDLGGSTPTAERLARITTQYAQARAKLRDAAERCSSRRFAEVVAKFHWDGSARHLAQAANPSNESIPIALVGGPLPASQWNLLDSIDAAGARVVVNATEAGERSLFPAPVPYVTDCDPIESLVRNYLENCVDVFQRPNTRLYAWLKERLRSRRVRGIALWHYVGCDLWRAEAQRLREAFGLPLLVLDADGTGGDSSRMIGRIQSFVELLRRI